MCSEFTEPSVTSCSGSPGLEGRSEAVTGHTETQREAERDVVEFEIISAAVFVSG